MNNIYIYIIKTYQQNTMENSLNMLISLCLMLIIYIYIELEIKIKIVNSLKNLDFCRKYTC